MHAPADTHSHMLPGNYHSTLLRIERSDGWCCQCSVSFPAASDDGQTAGLMCRRGRPKFAYIVLTLQNCRFAGSRERYATLVARKVFAICTTYNIYSTLPDAEPDEKEVDDCVHLCVPPSVCVPLTDNDLEGHDTIMGIKCAERERRGRRRRRHRRPRCLLL